MREENQRIRITKKMLKDSLIKLLYQESIHKLSVKRICEDAEINRTTFYNYYGSQYDLLEEMERDLLIQINDSLGVATWGGDNTEKLIKTISSVHDNIDLCKLLLNNNIDPEFPEKLVLSLRLIPNLIDRKTSNKYSNDEFEYIFDFVIGGGFAFMKKWINNENRETPEEIAVLFNDTIERVLVT